jgi:hypothetical protein
MTSQASDFYPKRVREEMGKRSLDDLWIVPCALRPFFPFLLFWRLQLHKCAQNMSPINGQTRTFHGWIKPIYTSIMRIYMPKPVVQILLPTITNFCQNTENHWKNDAKPKARKQ